MDKTKRTQTMDFLVTIWQFHAGSVMFTLFSLRVKGMKGVTVIIWLFDLKTRDNFVYFEMLK